jgi:malate synthase
MMINAFNSGADVFMADFEDSLSPTMDDAQEYFWQNPGVQSHGGSSLVLCP